MPTDSSLPAANPSEDWFADWPFDVSTIVRLSATISGPGAEAAVTDFLSTLMRDDSDESAEGAYYRGGYAADVSGDAQSGQWQILLSSGGEDGFDSVLAGVDDLVEALRGAPGDVKLRWQELPAIKSDH